MMVFWELGTAGRNLQSFLQKQYLQPPGSAHALSLCRLGRLCLPLLTGTASTLPVWLKDWRRLSCLKPNILTHDTWVWNMMEYDVRDLEITTCLVLFGSMLVFKAVATQGQVTNRHGDTRRKNPRRSPTRMLDTSFSNVYSCWCPQSPNNYIDVCIHMRYMWGGICPPCVPAIQKVMSAPTARAEEGITLATAPSSCSRLQPQALEDPAACLRFNQHQTLIRNHNVAINASMRIYACI